MKPKCSQESLDGHHSIYPVCLVHHSPFAYSFYPLFFCSFFHLNNTLLCVVCCHYICFCFFILLLISSDYTKAIQFQLVETVSFHWFSFLFSLLSSLMHFILLFGPQSHHSPFSLLFLGRKSPISIWQMFLLCSKWVQFHWGFDTVSLFFTFGSSSLIWNMYR